jgi:hypothetical protein
MWSPAAAYSWRILLLIGLLAIELIGVLVRQIAMGMILARPR